MLRSGNSALQIISTANSVRLMLYDYGMSNRRLHTSSPLF